MNPEMEQTYRIREELVEFLKENLRIEVEDNDFTDPNGRRVALFLGDVEISSASFTVRERPEYEG